MTTIKQQLEKYRDELAKTYADKDLETEGWEHSNHVNDFTTGFTTAMDLLLPCVEALELIRERFQIIEKSEQSTLFIKNVACGGDRLLEDALTALKSAIGKKQNG